jgi:hypothetical protein
LFNTIFLVAEHKYYLAIQLVHLDCAYTLAIGQKYNQLAELASSQAKFELAQQCLLSKLGLQV